MATPDRAGGQRRRPLIYMKSSNTSDGRMLLDVNFEVGTDQDTANVLTQNRVSAAQARLPVDVTQQGVTVKKQSPSILMLISIYSPTGCLRRQLPDQLRRHQPARPVAAHSGHRPGGPVRRHRLRHAHLVPARPARQAGPDPGRRDQRHQGAEPAGAHRQGRRRAHARGPAVHQHRQRAGPPGHARRSSRTSSCGRATTGAVVRIKDIGRAELGSQDYNAFGRLERQAGRRDGGLPAARRQPARRRPRRSTRRWKRRRPASRPAWTTRSSTTRRRPWRRRSKASCIRFVEALILVTLVVFIFLQNIRATIIPLITDPGVADRHLHLLPDARLFGQHAVDVRPGAGHRHRRRRRHRRGRGGDPPPRARHEPEGGDDPGDGGGDGAGDRHRADPVGGVRPRRHARRAGRQHVQAVRADHRHLGAAVGLQRAVADARAVRDAAEAARSRCAARWAASSRGSTRPSTSARRVT